MTGITTTREIQQLQQLARLYGIETTNYGSQGKPQEAEPHSLLAALRALGVPLTSLGEVPEVLRRRRLEVWERCLEPVVVAWEGEAAAPLLNLPAGCADSPACCHLILENGEEHSWTCDLATLPVRQAETVEGREYVVKQLTFPLELPRGYHSFALSHPDCTSEALVISAPRRLYIPAYGRLWGVFLPLYALHSARSWGAGDFTDLTSLVNWVLEQGGQTVGVLPLLASFLDEPFDPSPYAPVSRLFWNEFYLDVTAIPELEHSPAARELLAATPLQEEITSLRRSATVDYRRGMALKRRVLEHLTKSLFDQPSRRREELQQWVAANPAALDYARFRAAVEQQRAGWPAWPDRMREGVLEEGDYHRENVRYHLYVQWLAAQQLQQAAARARKGGAGLYLDFPLGVHSAGYDTWRGRSLFALEAGCGAPPDAFMQEGQNWGMPPLHPERLRTQGYRYYIASLRNHFRYAGFLRIDHVMGLHRLFWVPRGLPARDGVYVHYRAEEFYAILALESQRFRCAVVGEDLGTVPDYVRPAMARHGLHRMYVLPFELTGDPRQVLRPVPVEALACLNTHDMRPFADFWANQRFQEGDALCGYLRRLGWLEATAGDPRAGLAACLAYLAASPARLLLVNLEDLWLEKAPQNAPDLRDYPNWRRKAACALEDLSHLPGLTGLLQEIDRLRRR